MQHIYRKVMDGNASKCDVFTGKSQMERLPSVMYLHTRAEGPRWDCVSPDNQLESIRLHLASTTLANDVLSSPSTSVPGGQMWASAQ